MVRTLTSPEDGTVCKYGAALNSFCRSRAIGFEGVASPQAEERDRDSCVSRYVRSGGPIMKERQDNVYNIIDL